MKSILMNSLCSITSDNNSRKNCNVIRQELHTMSVDNKMTMKENERTVDDGGKYDIIAFSCFLLESSMFAYFI